MRALTSFAAFALAALALPTATHAQAPVACKGKVFVDSVYQNGLGGGKYEYMLQLRNATSRPIHWQLDFHTMPQGVTVFTQEMKAGFTPLAPNQTTTVRFGKGTNGQINVGTVRVTYDTPSGNIELSNCY